MRPEEWVNLARHRLPSAFRRVRYGSLRQLEMKVCEAGPGDMRPNPIHLRTAVNELIGSEVFVEHVPNPPGISFPGFHFARGFSPENARDAGRRAEVIALYETFMRANIEDSGKTLERTVYRAVLEAHAAGTFLAVIGSPDHPPGQRLVLNDVEIEQALDLILVARDGIVALEDKNEREWLGPSSLEVWELIGKALRLNALPVLVCRKVTYDLFFLFKQIGALAFQMHGQRFPATFAQRLARVQHKDGLGFADIRYGDAPSPGLIRFIGDTVPRLLGERLELFRENSELLREYAINQRLEEDLPGPQRRAIYREFFRRLKGWEEQEHEGGEDFDNEY